MDEAGHSSLPPSCGRVDLIMAADILGAPRVPSGSAEWSMDVQDVEITQTRLEPYFPDAPPDELWMSRDGQICAPRPRGSGWTARSWGHETASERTSLFELTRSGEHFLLFARDVEARDGHARNLQALRERYRCPDEAGYGRVAYRPPRFVEQQGRIALEVVMQGTRMRPTGARSACGASSASWWPGRTSWWSAPRAPRALAQLGAERARLFVVTRFFHLR
ncbi:MAG: hypothetical protein WKG00_31900 [Polyangiaceae bacterium]